MRACTRWSAVVLAQPQPHAHLRRGGVRKGEERRGKATRAQGDRTGQEGTRTQTEHRGKNDKRQINSMLNPITRMLHRFVLCLVPRLHGSSLLVFRSALLRSPPAWLAATPASAANDSACVAACGTVW
jgi:hypothetical protein